MSQNNISTYNNARLKSKLANLTSSLEMHKGHHTVMGVHQQIRNIKNELAKRAARKSTKSWWPFGRGGKTRRHRTRRTRRACHTRRR